MHRLAAVLACTIVLTVTSPSAAGEDQNHSAPRGGDVHKTLQGLLDGFRSGDAKNVAALWTPDGELLGPRGERIVGREKVEAAFREFFAGHKNVKIRIGAVAQRQLSPDVVLVDAVSEMTPVPEGLAGQPRATILLVRRDGRWLIDSLRETIDAEPSHHGRLKELGWLVGDWTVAAPSASGLSMHSACDWTANGNFLIRKYTVESRHGVAMAGTEVIGWDPRSQRIHSWVFDFDGGFGESVWTHDGNRWTVKYNGVLADGGDVSVTHILTPVDAGTHTFRSTGRQINGVERADAAEVTIRRVAPTAGGTKVEPAKPPRQVLP